MTDKDDPTSKPLVDFLRDNDARCPVCSYNLRACPSSRCPECGVELSLTVVVPGALGGWWLAGMFGAGFSVLVTTVLVIGQLGRASQVLQQPAIFAHVRSGVIGADALPNWSALLILCTLATAMLALLAWLMRGKRSFLQRPHAWQVIVGLLCAGSPIIIIGAIALFARWF